MVAYEPDHLSASQINVYLLCGLKYRFQYVDRLPKPFKSSGLAFGSVIHSTIDWFHKHRIEQRQVTLDQLYRILEADWYSQQCEEKIRFKDGEDASKLLVMARELLGLYYHSPLNGMVQAELPFRVPLVNPLTGENLGAPLDGFIDLIEANDTITEFKTSARSLDADSVDDLLQLTTYSYAYRVLFGRDPQRLKVVNFVKTRTPKLNVLDAAARKPQDYARLFHLAKEVLRGIRSGIFFPRQSFICNDCEYERPCGEWKGNLEIGPVEKRSGDEPIPAYA
ncbi:MAG: PD-(D/E)XK nuclease family protein [Candidatus Paceibacterota bacterium]|jgi:putative RecB family exonuclease